MGSDAATTDDGDRCRCGQVLAQSHRYCPSCGAPRVASAADGGSSVDDESVLLLGPAGGRAVTEATVRTGRSGLAARVIGAGLAVVALALIWTLFRQPSSEVAPDPASEEASADTAPSDGRDDDDTDDDTDDDDDRESDDGEAEEVAEEGREEAEEADGPATTNSTGRGSTSSDPSADGDEPDDGPTGPVLGEPTGLSLAVGRIGRSEVELLDLDTGETRQVRAAGGVPVGALGSMLVLTSEMNGTSTMVDLSDPEAETISLAPRRNAWSQVIEISDGLVWLISEGIEEQPTMQAFDASGQQVDEREIGLYSYFGLGPSSIARPSVLSYDPAGGLYRRDGDDFQRVAEGQVLAAGEELALARECDEALRCQLVWYDFVTSEPIDLPVPAESDGQSFYSLAGSDRWLLAADWPPGGGQLIEVATGEVVREVDIGNYFGLRPLLGISDDGRWFIDQVAGELVIVDLESGVEWPTGVTRGDMRAVFIDGLD